MDTIQVSEYEHIVFMVFSVPSMIGIDEGEVYKLRKYNVLDEKMQEFSKEDLKKLYDQLMFKEQRIKVWRWLKTIEKLESKEYKESVKESILSQIA